MVKKTPWGRLYKWRRGYWHYKRRPRGRWIHSKYGRKHRRRRHFSRVFRRRLRRAIHTPHPGSYTVRRANPYNKLDIFFQGTILVPSTVGKAGELEGAWFTTRIDFSFANMLRAVYQTYYAGPQSVPPFSVPEIKPSDWYKWSYLMMAPKDQNRPSKPYKNQTDNFTPTQMQDMFQQYQLFRHVKTSLAVLNTYVASSVPSPDVVSVLASLLTQDRYFMPANAAHYLSFLELSAFGASWCFPPGQRCTGRGLMSKHSFTGSNDPMVDRWLPMIPLPDHFPGTSEIEKIFAQLHLALFTPLEDKASRGTSLLPIVNDPVSQYWALIRVKSWFQLGNVSPLAGYNVIWPKTTPQ